MSQAGKPNASISSIFCYNHSITNNIVHLVRLIAVILLVESAVAQASMSTAYAADAQNGWSRQSFVTNVWKLARDVDLRNTIELERFLGVAIPLRRYCAYLDCTNQLQLGVVHAFPDQPIQLPGAWGVTAQFYRPDSMDPPGSDLGLVGTLAVLDLFTPPTSNCLRRADVRHALGTETASGASLNRDEPNEVALSYDPVRAGDHRTKIEFVFSGSMIADGCLAYASIREDNFEVVGDLALRHASFNPFSIREGTTVFFNEEPLDPSSPKDPIDVSATTSPLGMDLAVFKSKFSQCKIDEPYKVDQLKPLTDVGPPFNEALPTYQGAFLGTTHSFLETLQHGRPKMAVLDSSMLNIYYVRCSTGSIPPQDVFSNLVVFQDHIAAIQKIARSLHKVYAPAGILAAEAVAQASSGQKRFRQLTDDSDRFTSKGQQVIVAASSDEDHEVIVSAQGPNQRRRDRFLYPSSVTYVFVDRKVWSAYQHDVEAKIRSVLPETSSGLTEICLPGECDQIFSQIPKEWLNRSSGQIISLIAKVVSAGNLTLPETFGSAADHPVVVSTDQARHRSGSAVNQMRNVGLYPGKSILDGVSFTYRIGTLGFPLEQRDNQPRLPPYHELAAKLTFEFGSKFGTSYCVKIDDVIAAFGPNQIKDGRPVRGEKLVYKFLHGNGSDNVIYVTFSFTEEVISSFSPNPECAYNAIISDYRLIRAQ